MKDNMNKLDSHIIDLIVKEDMNCEEVSATLSSVIKKMIQLPQNKQLAEDFEIDIDNITTRDVGVLIIYWTDKYINSSEEKYNERY